MQRESVKQGKSARHWIVWLAVLIAAPATLLAAWRFGNRKPLPEQPAAHRLCDASVFVRFEHKKPQARELVTIAVMSAVAVASRAGFIMVPFFKPLTGIVMITGMALGPEAGFLTGAVSGFVSNFIFGQGPWTPWQMFAFGVAGFLTGRPLQRGGGLQEKRLPAGLFGGICVLILIGPIPDTCSLFTMSTEIMAASAAGIYLAGLPVNAVHACNFLTVFFLESRLRKSLTGSK
ncbi:MAG: ECF transporter S component [Lachnospiraceae bacterium]